MIRLELYSNLPRDQLKIYFLRCPKGDTATERGEIRDLVLYKGCYCAYMCTTRMEIFSVSLGLRPNLFVFVYLEVLWEGC